MFYPQSSLSPRAFHPLPCHPSRAAASGNSFCFFQNFMETERLWLFACTFSLPRCFEIHACCRVCECCVSVYHSILETLPCVLHVGTLTCTVSLRPSPPSGAQAAAPSGGAWRAPGRVLPLSPADKPARLRARPCCQASGADAAWPRAGSGQTRRAAAAPDCPLLPSGRRCFPARGQAAALPRPARAAARHSVDASPGETEARRASAFPSARTALLPRSRVLGAAQRGTFPLRRRRRGKEPARRGRGLSSPPRPPRCSSYSSVGRRPVRDAVETPWRGAASSPLLSGRLTAAAAAPFFLLRSWLPGQRRDLQGGFV